MQIYYISTNGVAPKGAPETPGGLYIDLQDIRFLGDVVKNSEGVSFQIYMKSGWQIPVPFSPDVPMSDVLDMHSQLAAEWQKENGFKPVEVSVGNDAVTAQEDPDGSNTKVAEVLALLVCYLTKEGVEQEDKAAWSLVDDFSQQLLAPFGESVLGHYYKKRDADIEL